jgi:hypothetical protein
VSPLSKPSKKMRSADGDTAELVVEELFVELMS